LSQSIIYIRSTIIITGNGGMLLAISVISASITIFITFVGNPVSAQIITTNMSWLEDITDSESEETESEETESEETESEETEPSESLTLRGLSRQGESDLAVACSILPELC
jgi:hypothetical protein